MSSISDVTGVRRRSEWVADDLLQALGELEEGLEAKVHGVLEEAAVQLEATVEAHDRQRAKHYMHVLTGDPRPRPRPCLALALAIGSRPRRLFVSLLCLFV